MDHGFGAASAIGILMLIAVMTILAILAQKHGERIGAHVGEARGRRAARRDTLLEVLEELDEAFEDIKGELERYDREEFRKRRKALEEVLAASSGADSEHAIDDVESDLEELKDFLDELSQAVQAERGTKSSRTGCLDDHLKLLERLRAKRQAGIHDSQTDSEPREESLSEADATISPPWANPPVCSNCGSTRVAWVEWGFVSRVPAEALRDGRVVFGGDVVFDDSPLMHWRCWDCAERELGKGHSDCRYSHLEDILVGMFDPNESDAAKEARRRAEHAERETNRAQEAAYRATPVGAYEHLRALILQAQEDVQKAERGNKAAGARVRRIMREAKIAASGVRRAILSARQGDGQSLREQRE